MTDTSQAMMGAEFNPHKNESIPDLIALQAEMPTIAMDSENPAFKRDGKVSKYMSLTALMETIRPLLEKHHFAWVTCPDENYLAYTLTHKTGNSVAKGRYPLPVDVTPQQLGSAITYARRYSLCAVLGIVADTDDDGNGVPADGAASTETPGDRARAMAQEKGVEGAWCPECQKEKTAGKEVIIGKLRPAKGGPHKGEMQCSGKVNGAWADHVPYLDPSVEPFYDNAEVPF